jgi:serine/threonine-protein kinase
MESKTYLGRYRITLDQYEQPIRLRRDGPAVIYKAFDGESSREVALEIIPAGSIRISQQSKMQDSAEAAKRLQQINIPTLYDFGVEDNEFIYATEIVEGISAENWVTSQGPMPVGSALRIAAQVVNAIRAATFHGIFHPALNPSNIMIVPGQTAEGEWPLIKVLNFVGLPPKYSHAEASAASVTDRVNFVAPEQLESGETTFDSEIYSLGCTLWFLLSGVPPLAGAATVESASRVPAPVRNLIARMLATNPADRPHDPVALHDQIEDCIAEVENKRVVTPAAEVAAPVALGEARVRRPFPWQPLAVAAVLLLLGGLAAMVLPQKIRAWKGRSEIGVPVGVPDNVAAAASKTATAPPQRVEQSPSPLSATPGVLVSSANTNESDAANSSDTANSSDAASTSNTEPQAANASSRQTADVAPANTTVPQDSVAPVATPQQQPTAAPMIASNSRPQTQAEPPPPSEGPQQNEETTTADAAPAPAAEEKREIARTETPAARVRKAETTAPPTRSVAKKPRAVVSNHRVRQGNVRAQFLGTTPNGELVFGLPSDERAYLNPESPQRRDTRVRHRGRPEVRPAEPPDDLPVRPALPPDE